MTTLQLSESYADRALVLVAAVTGQLSKLAVSSGPKHAVEYANGGVVLREPAVVAKALAAGTPLAGKAGVASALVTQWLSWAYGASAGTEEGLKELDEALSRHSYVAGPAFSVADVVVFYMAHPALNKAGCKEVQARFPSVARWVDQVLREPVHGLASAVGAPQFTHGFTLKREPLNLFGGAAAAPAKAAAGAGKAAAVAAAAPAKKEAPAAAPAAAAAATAAAPAAAGAGAPAAPAAAGGKAKKEKAAAAGAGAAPAGGAAAAPAESSEPIAVCDLRVGLITKVWHHPEADKLFCEEIDLGEPSGPRQIASGLRLHYTLEQMQGRRVVVVCNLKPRPLVGFNSNGMVLAATSAEGKVELLDPPAGAAVGERVEVAGHSSKPAEPNAMAKKKWFDLAAEHLRVTDGLQAAYKGIPLTTSAGPVTVPTTKGATIH